jgi:hypothetical protein
MSREQTAKIIQVLRNYMNLSYESEATVATKSLLRVRAFLNQQPKTRGGIAPVGYVPLSSNNPNALSLALHVSLEFVNGFFDAPVTGLFSLCSLDSLNEPFFLAVG